MESSAALCQSVWRQVLLNEGVEHFIPVVKLGFCSFKTEKSLFYFYTKSAAAYLFIISALIEMISPKLFVTCLRADDTQ